MVVLENLYDVERLGEGVRPLSASQAGTDSECGSSRSLKFIFKPAVCKL